MIAYILLIEMQGSLFLPVLIEIGQNFDQQQSTMICQYGQLEESELAERLNTFLLNYPEYKKSKLKWQKIEIFSTK